MPAPQFGNHRIRNENSCSAKPGSNPQKTQHIRLLTYIAYCDINITICN